jgi:C_GCAxxG_C_C family probable redox protein
MILDEQQAERRAFELHSGGLHCAEAVLIAVLEKTEAGKNGLIPRMATCFGGGVGRTKEEYCGALAGGLMALGCLMGRDHAGDDWSLAAGAAVELRDRFKAVYGSTLCPAILAAMGPQQNGQLCKRLSGTTANLVCRIWNEHGR